MKTHNIKKVILTEYAYSELDTFSTFVFVLSNHIKVRTTIQDELDKLQIGYEITEVKNKKHIYKIDICQLDEKLFFQLKCILIKYMYHIYIQNPNII